MREGFTTGSCATGASIASAYWHIHGEYPEVVEFTVPAGKRLRLPVVALENGICGIVKDSGDDIDVTNGCLVTADVQISDTDGEIFFKGGKGVGIITEDGLKIPKGQPAINPVPRKMITQEVRKLIGNRSATITISIPDGEELAKNTFNGRLGIVGGISILGTTGIVKPLNEQALKDSLLLELSMRYKQGHRHIAFVPAHSAEQLLLKVHPEETCVIQINNYIGYMLDEAEKLGFESILIFGQAGKLIKLAGNIMNTHSHIADCKNEIICTHSALSGASREIIQSLYDCKNISQSIQILEQNGLTCVWEKIAGKAVENCLARTHGKIKISIEIYNKEIRLA